MIVYIQHADYSGNSAKYISFDRLGKLLNGYYLNTFSSYRVIIKAVSMSLTACAKKKNPKTTKRPHMAKCKAAKMLLSLNEDSN